MGRIGTQFKTDLLNKANGKSALIDDYIVIPRGKIDCVSCSQSFPVTDLVTKRLECPQCHTTAKLLVDGKELDQLRNPQKKVTEITVTKEKQEPAFLIHEDNPIKKLGENFWYNTKDDLMKSPDKDSWEQIRKKSLEEYPDGAKFIPNENLIEMYKMIINGNEKVTELEGKIIHEQMEKRKLWDRIKGKPENFDTTGEKKKEKIIAETKKEIEKDNVLDSIRKRLRNDEQKEFDKLPDDKKDLTAEIQIKTDEQLEKDKRLIAEGKADEKTKKRVLVMDRLKKKYGDDLENRVGYIIVRLEGRALMMFTGGDEVLDDNEKDDLAFGWELILVKYGMDNLIMMLPELMLIGMHIEIFGGHAYEKHKKNQAKKNKKIEEKKNIKRK